MDPIPALLIAAILFAAAGSTAGVLFSHRTPPNDPDRSGNDGLLQFWATVHTGWEQTLIGLARELPLPRTAADLAYGQLCLDPQDEHRLIVRTRSELGRGLIAAIDLHPAHRHTTVVYTLLRLPDDDSLHPRISTLETDLLAALHRLDPRLVLDRNAAPTSRFDSTNRRSSPPPR